MYTNDTMTQREAELLAQVKALTAERNKAEAFLARIASLRIDETGTACFSNSTDGRGIDAWRVAEQARQTFEQLAAVTQERDELWWRKAWLVLNHDTGMQLDNLKSQLATAQEKRNEAIIKREQVIAWRKQDEEMIKRLLQQLAERDAMTWTTYKPAVPGWYWRKYQSTNKELVVIEHVIREGSYLVVAYYGGTVDAATGEWAGPIDPPKEAQP